MSIEIEGKSQTLEEFDLNSVEMNIDPGNGDGNGDNGGNGETGDGDSGDDGGNGEYGDGGDDGDNGGNGEFDGTSGPLT